MKCGWIGCGKVTRFKKGEKLHQEIKSSELVSETYLKENFADYKKGDFISAEALRLEFGPDCYGDDFNLKCLQVRDAIMSAIRRHRGELVFIRSREGGLEILTDEKAVEYSKRNGDNLADRFLLNHTKMEAIDRSKLTANTLGSHDRNLQNFGLQSQWLRKARSRVVPDTTPVKRSTPEK